MYHKINYLIGSKNRPQLLNLLRAFSWVIPLIALVSAESRVSELRAASERIIPFIFDSGTIQLVINPGSKVVKISRLRQKI
jgi:hypothetical protein